MMNIKNEKNLAMLMDFYELTMSNSYLNHNEDTKVVFDMFFRKVPDKGGYAIMAGLEQFVDYIQNLRFNIEDIEYLRTCNLFSEEFLTYLKLFKFTGNVWAIPEGEAIFPNEPIVTIEAPIIEAQLIETMLLLCVNHQSLIATKSSRIVKSANGKPVLEFGARRAHGVDGALYGARASLIGGAIGTATTLTGQMFDCPVSGTMAHSYIQFYGDEYIAFKKYAQTYPDSSLFLVDTYDVIHSGIPNAIKVAKEILEPNGHRLKGIRLDSGDLAYLSKKVRKMLDKAGMEDCKIVASNSLDEYIIQSLNDQGAKIDIYGVGERMITSKSEPVFGGVYKISAVLEDGVYAPRIKVSENFEKITNPGYKTVWRLYDRETGKAIADVITLKDEIIDDTKPYTIFDPVATWKKKELTNFKAVKLQVEIFRDGEFVYNTPSLQEIVAYSKVAMETIWEEVKRFDNPHNYYVDLSQELWDLKNDMLKKLGKIIQ